MIRLRGGKIMNFRVGIYTAACVKTHTKYCRILESGIETRPKIRTRGSQTNSDKFDNTLKTEI